MANCIVINAECGGCLARHMAERKLIFDVRTSAQATHGELIVADETGVQNFGRVLCGGVCPLAVDQYAKLVERIRAGDHPAYGSLTWDGRSRTVEITVRFDDGNSSHTSAEVMRARAERYLASLTPEEQSVVNLQCEFRDGAPVKATLRGGTGLFSAARLRELAGRA